MLVQTRLPFTLPVALVALVAIFACTQAGLGAQGGGVEKAKAAVLQIQHASDARKAEEIATAERERIKLEARERIEMFKEVLEIDPDDPLATFGTGAAYMQLNEYAEAIPFLEKATLVQKDYSAAFLNLGKCHEFLAHRDEARAAYRPGIEAANRKGDLMPLREMERRLKNLESPQPTPQ